MTGRILIVDPVSSNRIVMKVKMMAAQYAVETADTLADAKELLAEDPPDLLMVNLATDTTAGLDFCRHVRAMPKTSDIAIIASNIPEAALSRFAALDAGVDDILPRPIHDGLLLARVRSLLRRRNVTQDLVLRDGTSGVFGFEEEARPLIGPAQITVLCRDAREAMPMATSLQTSLRQSIHLAIGHGHLDHAPGDHDLIILQGADRLTPAAAVTQIVSDLKSRSDTRHAEVLVVLPDDDSNLAAMVLDLGAADVVFASAASTELALRAKRLVRAKAQTDSLRERIRSGLQAAITDALTGLHNRRYAEAQLSRIARASAATRSDYAVMIMDIDHFKTINDTYGHAAGDQVLRELAGRLRSICREDDLLARIGGEEFLLAMPDTELKNAEAAGERIRRLIAATPFKLTGHDTQLQVTISIGIAAHLADNIGTWPAQQTFGTLCQEADSALYSAKSAGRDAVSVAYSAA